jgi:endonuclease III
MNSLPASLHLLNFPLLQRGLSPIDKSVPYQGMVALALRLQNTVIQQQAMIEALMEKVKNGQKSLEEPVKSTQSIQVKVEDEIIPQLNKESSFSDSCSKIMSDSTEDERSDYEETNVPKISRRNGFKKTKHIKSEGLDSENASKLKSSSKAKHLWVNYGRRIIEYAVNQTQGPIQFRAKQLIGKLNSKKDFEKAFMLTANDSAEERLFKTLLGRLAINFVKNKISPTFENSKYKDEMVTQRHVVAAWIERLIGE